MLFGIKGKDVEDLSESLSNEISISRVVSKEKRVGDVFSESHVPDNFFTGVVERKTNLSVLVGDGVLVGGLELLNEVFVSSGSETFSLFGVKENVVDEEDSVSDGSSDGGSVFGEDKGACGLEVEVDSDIVVLYVTTLPFGIFRVMSYAGTRLYLKPSLG